LGALAAGPIPAAAIFASGSVASLGALRTALRTTFALRLGISFGRRLGRREAGLKRRGFRLGRFLLGCFLLGCFLPGCFLTHVGRRIRFRSFHFFRLFFYWDLYFV
jgi:hypothetical protein